MLKKTILFFSLFTWIHFSYANTCPSLSDLKADKLQGWAALNLDSAEPLSDSERREFESSAASFAFAEWIPDAPEGAGHCFYYGAIPEPDYLGVFLAKETGEPDKRAGDWHFASDDIMVCKKSIPECRFYPARG